VKKGETVLRVDGRAANMIRSIAITPNFSDYALGSVLIELGKTRILCAVSLNSGVPPFLKGKKTGWLSAEYAMLPIATHSRMQRESTGLKRQSRAIEISRLIGRVFRTIIDLDVLGEQTLLIDCDVIQADGGTRTAAITGANCALLIAQQKLLAAGLITRPFMKTEIAAISAGILSGECILDLNYQEDSNISADFNFVLTKSGKLIEVQGTAEHEPVDWEMFEQLHVLAQFGVKQIFSELAKLKIV
jgi:ribonuclease PH